MNFGINQPAVRLKRHPFPVVAWFDRILVAEPFAFLPDESGMLDIAFDPVTGPEVVRRV
jgi:hypothetical protein